MAQQGVIDPKNKNQPEQGSGMAIASMVLGILSIITFLIFFISIPLGILAIVFGVIANKKQKNGMATAGLVTGIVGIALSLIIIGLALWIGDELEDDPDFIEFIEKIEEADSEDN